MSTWWRQPRYIRVLTSTGRWEFMRVIERSPLHYLVVDATGHRLLVGRRRG